MITKNKFLIIMIYFNVILISQLVIAILYKIFFSKNQKIWRNFILYFYLFFIEPIFLIVSPITINSQNIFKWLKL